MLWSRNRTVETFEQSDLGEDWAPEENKLIRPSATWTYLVHDNPFGSGLEETMKGLVKMVRGQRR